MSPEGPGSESAESARQPPGPAPPSPDSPRSTVTIVDDAELPDAVYVEGDLGGSSSSVERSTVFIDDKDSSSAIVSMEVATSAARIEPRLRDRRIAVKRAVGRKRLRWIALGTAAVGIVVAALAVLGSGLFEIDHIEVDGVVYSGGPAFDEVVADLAGENVLRVDTRRFEEALERIPWVADARVTTDFPDGARIEIAERTPVVAYQGTDARWRVLDIDGRVLDVLDGQPADFLQLVPSDEAPSLAPGATAPRGYIAAAALVQALGDSLRAGVATLSVDGRGTDLQLELGTGTEVRFGAANDLRDKLVRLQIAMRGLDAESPPELIDVSTQDFVVR